MSQESRVLQIRGIEGEALLIHTAPVHAALMEGAVGFLLKKHEKKARAQ
jgi:hypothetical protein